VKHILTSFYTKPLSIYLVYALILVSAFASPAEAMFLPAAPQVPADQVSSRSSDLGVIQRALESKALEQRLVDYGLSPGKAMEKIDNLSDEQVHRLAANISALQAGSRGGRIDTNTLIIILLLVLLIVILVQNTTGTETNRA
jgi:hypothetical protein